MWRFMGVRGLGVEDGFEAVEVPQLGLQEVCSVVAVRLFVGEAALCGVEAGGFEVGLEGIVHAFDDGEVIEGEGAGFVYGEGSGTDAGFVLDQILLAGDGVWEGHGEMWVGIL